MSIDGSITILDSESFYLPNVQMNIIENGFNFWVGNYSGISRSGKVVPSGKMTKVRMMLNIYLDLNHCFVSIFKG